ncbi:MAG: bifunctional adenosylcobinamide kinase/adenosylcobinamide-phosphate guanylyltransferase [Bacteroidales bacterium]|nr:bifunctional adenosylcobinamide kinase/adenosylcobinamide-phosphate guanylyltransferase [Bacteroidales bacterium]
MSKITLIIGGQRSGKSSFAQKLALSLSNRPVYIATSRIWDDEYSMRIKRHKADRGDKWINVEEEKFLSKHEFPGGVIVIDCVTLWATNFFFDLGSDVESALESLKHEFERFISQEAKFIFVSNEIGLGGVSENTIQRKFTDLQGWLNQYIADRADEVFFMAAGIPIKIK